MRCRRGAAERQQLDAVVCVADGHVKVVVTTAAAPFRGNASGAGSLRTAAAAQQPRVAHGVSARGQPQRLQQRHWRGGTGAQLQSQQRQVSPAPHEQQRGCRRCDRRGGCDCGGCWDGAVRRARRPVAVQAQSVDPLAVAQRRAPLQHCAVARVVDAQSGRRSDQQQTATVARLADGRGRGWRHAYARPCDRRSGWRVCALTVARRRVVHRARHLPVERLISRRVDDPFGQRQKESQPRQSDAPRRTTSERKEKRTRKTNRQRERAEGSGRRGWRQRVERGGSGRGEIERREREGEAAEGRRPFRLSAAVSLRGHFHFRPPPSD